MNIQNRRRFVLAVAGILVNGLALPGASSAAYSSRKLVLGLVDNRYPNDREILTEGLARTLADTTLRRVDLEFVVVPRDVRVDRARFRSLVDSRRIDIFLVVGEDAIDQVRAVAPEKPLIFHVSNDPRESRLINSVQQPGGNMTGFASYLPTHRKRWEILREAFPGVERIMVPVDSEWPHRRHVAEEARLESAKGVPISLVEIDSKGDIAGQLRLRLRGNRLGIDVPYTPVTRWPARLVDTLEDLGWPAIYDGTYYVHWGGLMSYEADPLPEVSLYAEYLNLILHGMPPGAIPVRFPSSFTLALNLKTAARTGIAFPKSLLKRANVVVGAESS